MRLFVIKVVVFLFVPFLLASSLDYYVSKKLKSTKNFPGENEVWNDIYDGNIIADIAIYGSSRAWVQFDPGLIKKELHISCYNFGEDGSNIVLQYVRHKQFLKFNLKPKLIILSVDIWTLRRSVNPYPTTRFYPYMLFKFDVKNTLESNSITFNPAYFSIPFLRYLKAPQILKLLPSRGDSNFVTVLGNYKLPFTETGNVRINGFRGMEISFSDDEFSRNQNQLKNSIVEVDTNLITAIRKFVVEVLEDDISLLMIYPPELKMGQKIVTNRQEIMSQFINISNDYGIPFYDYSDSTLSYNKEYFYNVQHLNKTGAEIFTINLIDNVLKPIGKNLNYIRSVPK